jgi:hypothetical protein
MITTKIGEYIVGAYLKFIEKCDFVDYNVRPPEKGLKGLGELDVVGISFVENKVFLCEVTTHILGLSYKDNISTVSKIQAKHERQKDYARKYLSKFNEVSYSFWSPVVPVGYLTTELEKIENLELVINKEYSKRFDDLVRLANEITGDKGNPAFRMLQIQSRLKR